MTFEIALGVAIGMIIANNITKIIDFCNDVFTLIFNLCAKVYHGIIYLIRQFLALPWYYKILVLAACFYLTIIYEWIDGLIALVFISALLIGLWAVRIFTDFYHKITHKNK